LGSRFRGNDGLGISGGNNILPSFIRIFIFWLRRKLARPSLMEIAVLSKNRSGLSLVELLISTAILGIIMVGLHQVLDTSLTAYGETRARQDLLMESRLALERLGLFIRESDMIVLPDTAAPQETLKVSERVSDAYDNSTHAYLIDGDGFLDADNDNDGLVNEGGADPVDLITFRLDKTDPNNWKLIEEAPDYGTAAVNDYLPTQVLCENVTSFGCALPTAGLVEIQLTLTRGLNQASLTTRARTRLLQ